jgi:hypothetical protein
MIKLVRPNYKKIFGEESAIYPKLAGFFHADSAAPRLAATSLTAISST